MAYADYYERALTNGVLNIQICNEPGIMIYMLPQEAESSKIAFTIQIGKTTKVFLKVG